MKRVREGLDSILEIFQIALFMVMVVVGTYQILVRYLFNSPSTVSEELLTYVFAWLSLLAAVYMFGKRGHMRMGFVADQAKERVKQGLELISQCFICCFAAVVMVYGGIRITSLTMSQKTASLGIPMGYVYSIVPVGGVLIFIYGVLNIGDLAEISPGPALDSQAGGEKTEGGND